jgi:hypothetical protein
MGGGTVNPPKIKKVGSIRTMYEGTPKRKMYKKEKKIKKITF